MSNFKYFICINNITVIKKKFSLQMYNIKHINFIFLLKYLRKCYTKSCIYILSLSNKQFSKLTHCRA